MIVELRRYSIAIGRMVDMHARMRDILMPLFAAHGMPRPLAIWEAASGPTPQMVWMLGWPDVATRFESWRGFYPKWREVRDADLSPEFVQRTEISLLEPYSEGFGFDESPAAKDELWILRLRLGAGGPLKRVALNKECGALRAAGATGAGDLDYMVGDLPQSALLVSWRDGASRRRGLEKYEQNSGLRSQRAAEVAELGSCLIERADRIRLERVPYFGTPAWPISAAP
jgi:hypothetical protein